ncbi:Rieske 2Fe-2S domain-containing protein [Xanthobacter sp. DSM 24535]|uniref:aromatic ring-hydroxylating oxygenase subunit alpha n=1 Tax=Roseixanthobacter psychrophilus TaxID=3119917 RepID=UPI00372A66CD
MSESIASASRDGGAWSIPSLTRVPYRVYEDAETYRIEQQRIFQGPVWNFLCLEIEVPSPGDYRTTHVGDMPVVVSRGKDGELYAFENRCVHRGALICLEDGGNVPNFQCVYHAWSYDLEGNLKGVPFREGFAGLGGMPSSFCTEEHRPRKLRVTTICGLVFGSLSDDVPPIEEFLGDEVLLRMQRVLHKPVEIIGRFTQALPNNWKLYAENVRDTYHASLMHTFFATFRITRLSQGGGVFVSEGGGNHASASYAPKGGTDNAYQSLRSDNERLRLVDPSLLDTVDEFNDGIQLQILSVFPTFVLQQIHNCLAVRQIVPKGTNEMDLHWTYLGFEDDTPDLRKLRLKQSNLVGPAGYVSMEDGCVGGFVHRGIAAATEEEAIVEMGGDVVESQMTRATEASVRGFWKAYREMMGE